MQIILIWLIKGYRYFLSPWIGMHCRFHPTCSCYAIEAIEQFGAIKGSWLMITRLIRCHPFCEGGFDPVPSKPNIDNSLSNPPLSPREKYDRIPPCTKMQNKGIKTKKTTD